MRQQNSILNKAAARQHKGKLCRHQMQMHRDVQKRDASEDTAGMNVHERSPPPFAVRHEHVSPGTPGTGYGPDHSDLVSPVPNSGKLAQLQTSIEAAVVASNRSIIQEGHNEAGSAKNSSGAFDGTRETPMSLGRSPQRKVSIITPKLELLSEQRVVVLRNPANTGGPTTVTNQARMEVIAADVAYHSSSDDEFRQSRMMVQ